MKLLDKKSLSQQKANERKLEVEEGAKLARKVDALRETASKEELNLAKFRIEYIKTIQTEMSELIERRDSLRSTVDSLEERRKELLKPIDSELGKLKEKREELESLDHVIRETLAKLAKKEDELHAKETELGLLERKVLIKDGEVNINLEQSKVIKTEAEQRLHDVKGIESDTNTRIDRKIRELEEREASIAVRERTIDNYRQMLDARNLELNNKERLINDKYETLQRTIKRLK